MLKHRSRSYGKYTAWVLGKSAALAHSADVQQGPLSPHFSLICSCAGFRERDRNMRR
jgi:hypothetical protein